MVEHPLNKTYLLVDFLTQLSCHHANSPGTISKRWRPGSSWFAGSSLTWLPWRGIQPCRWKERKTDRMTADRSDRTTDWHTGRHEENTYINNIQGPSQLVVLDSDVQCMWNIIESWALSALGIGPREGGNDDGRRNDSGKLLFIYLSLCRFLMCLHLWSSTGHLLNTAEPHGS